MVIFRWIEVVTWKLLQSNTAAGLVRCAAHINSEHAPVPGVIQAGILNRKFRSRELSNGGVERLESLKMTV